MGTSYKIEEQDEVHYLTFQIVKWVDLFTRNESESRREWILNLFEFSAKQHKRNEKYQVWTHENHAEICNSSARNYAGLPCILEICVFLWGLNAYH